MARDQNDQTLVERIDPLLGAVFDRRFRIVDRIAAGGFGAIYRAHHVSSSREVALKVLHPSLTHDPGVIARFRREGATLTALRSPNTITAYELGEAPDGTLYIVMELLHGESLFERFRAKGPIPWRSMVHIARAVCRSLEEAHALGIVHRDLKPTNIHLETDPGGGELVKVLDFGIVKILRGSEFDSSELTKAGQMIGTLDYMSPEQMVGGIVTGQSDIYTLGIVMYEMISGRRPFEDTDSPVAALAQMLKSTPLSLSKRTPVPPELDAIVMRCLDREPQRRYLDVIALGRALDRLVEGDEVSEEVTYALPGISEETRTVSEVEEVTSSLPFDLGAATDKVPKLTPPRAASTDDDRTVTPIRKLLDDRSVTPVRKVVVDYDKTITPGDDRTVTPGRIDDDRTITPGRVDYDATVNPFDRSITPGTVEDQQTIIPRGDERNLMLPAPVRPSQAPRILPPRAGTSPVQQLQPQRPPQRVITPLPLRIKLPAPPTAGGPKLMLREQNQPQFDMVSMAARDATIRRIVWVLVLVIGAVLGFVLTTRL